MSRARNVTDPIERNVMIACSGLPMGVNCRPKHRGVHEHCVKVSSCFVKIQEGRRS
jgi:hypothetical protein